MPIVVGGTTDYTTLTILKASLGITDTNDDIALEAAITAASRAIDDLCETTFYGVTETRLFETDTCSGVYVDRFTDATGLLVNSGRNGTYGTTITATPFPYGATARGGAYSQLRVPNGNLTLSSGLTGPTVQVTATWGWTTVPATVAEACKIKAAHLYERKNSRDGVAGTSEFGVVRISKFEDPDVWMLLHPYMLVGPR